MQFGRKEQPRDRRRVTPGAVRTPTFSYHASRTPLPERPAMPTKEFRRQRMSGTGLPRIWRRIGLRHVPLVLALLAAVVCSGKLIFVAPNPKIVIVSKDQATYAQSAAVYTDAAAKLLRADAMNRIKPFADLQGVATKLAAQFPEIQSVSATIPLMGNRPVFYIVPSVPVLQLRVASGDYLVDGKGSVLAQVSAGAQTSGTLVADQTGLKPVVGKQVLPGTTVAFIRTIAYQFTAAGHAVGTIVLPQGSAYEIDVQVVGVPYQVRMNVQADATEQAGAAIATLKQLGNQQLAYLDVRVPGRVYYK